VRKAWRSRMTNLKEAEKAWGENGCNALSPQEALSLDRQKVREKEDVLPKNEVRGST